MSNGIILAGGQASRLGPLSTQISKALVSIGQRPHVFHQIELMEAANCEEIVVVTNPSTQVQVRTALDRAGHYNVKVVTQKNPRGPVDAILVGLQAFHPNRRMHSTYVLMSDTFIEEKLEQHSQTWIGQYISPVKRSFCWRDGQGYYQDSVVNAGSMVTIGAYHFADTVELFSNAAATMASKSIEPEVGMSALLNRFPSAKPAIFKTWLDIGDVTALGQARRTRFIARSEHTLTLDSAGLLTKKGSGEQFLAQRSWLLDQAAMPARSANLVPRVYDVTSGGYVMEYIDLPTLSELWLYWPGRPDTWAQILTSILDRLERDLWPSIKPYEPIMSAGQVAQWFTTKAHERLASLDHGLAARHFDMLEKASLVFTASSIVRAHGDLNFNNILYSLNTNTFKLIDPRGTPFMPLIYELAKLRYSYHGGFAAITHNLVDHTNGILLPDRDEECYAMDDVLRGYVSLEQLQVAEGCLLLAGAPMHNFLERSVMIERGVKLITEVIGK